MQTSRYLKTFSFEERPGSRLVFSTKKTSTAVLTDEVLCSIDRGTLSAEDLATLSKLGLIVPDKEAEKQSMLDYVDRLNARNSNLNISVVINLDCNFRCVYCYEEGMKGSLYMSDDTIGQLIGFIKARFTSDKKTLNIDFYGGEPLLSRGPIKYISEALQAFTRERGAEYSFTLVTNGSLFTGRVAEELSRVGLAAIKVTLDGPAEIHNRYRPFKTGAGSFDAIIRNLKETCDLVKIGIGGNFDRGNYEKFIPLLDFLEKEGLTPDRISNIKFSPVMKRPAGDTSPADYADGCMSVNEPWLFKADSLLREEVLRRGYRTSRLMPMPCQVEITDTYVVNFDGAVCKCPTFIGRKDYEIGNLRDGIRDYREAYKLDIWKNERCLECEYLPLCFGGCRYMAYIRDGNIDSIDCKKSYMDAALETLVRQDIKYRRPVAAG